MVLNILRDTEALRRKRKIAIFTIAIFTIVIFTIVICISHFGRIAGRKQAQQQEVQGCRSPGLKGVRIPASRAMSFDCLNDADANSSVLQPARVFPNDEPWQIHASKLSVKHMVQNAEQQLTHTRRLPLPTTLDAYVCGYHFRALYLGHGAHKVAYLLEAMNPNDDRGLKRRAA